MKSVVVLLFVLGCVAVVYAVYRARRAVNAPNEPTVTSGSLTETVRRLYALETTPDAYRMSASQRDYVRTNLDEFVSLQREDMERLVDDVLARFREKKEGAGELISEGELAEAEKSVRILLASLFAKAWCELRGVG